LKAFLGGDEEEERDARISVITACYKGVENPAKEIDNLAVAAAVLWVAKMDRQLIELLERIDLLPHHSLRLVYAAATFRLNKRVKQGRNVLKQLQNEHEKTKNPVKRTDLAVGIAYLFFHLWLCLGFSASWRQHPETNGRFADGEGQRLINNAIRYAKEAYERLGTRDMKKKVYALNQYLYYLVEGGGDDRRREMDWAARELSAYKPKRELWQYRFDDTLARYFHRLAVSAKDEEKWEELMKDAKRHIEEAWMDAHGDEEVESYLSILGVEKAASFQGGGEKR
jgi:hypothetical protein